ncbi:hypothetical protein [Caballeronia sordidicola]|uniref:hypothetical protein n=1 Tax=Caballeronia sordidicola TaxID=196367 RepID=UPI00094D7FFB|nr:hypothetical protein [Caballeronia sordidicola]
MSNEQKPIRNGVKTDRDTQPVQVRMLKSQIKVLKAIASNEGRTSSDVVRELVDGYIRYVRLTEKDPDRLEILLSTIRLTKYDEEVNKVNNWPYSWENGMPDVP